MKKTEKINLNNIIDVIYKAKSKATGKIKNICDWYIKKCQTNMFILPVTLSIVVGLVAFGMAFLASSFETGTYQQSATVANAEETGNTDDTDILVASAETDKLVASAETGKLVASAGTEDDSSVKSDNDKANINKSDDSQSDITKESTDSSKSFDTNQAASLSQAVSSEGVTSLGAVTGVKSYSETIKQNGQDAPSASSTQSSTDISSLVSDYGTLSTTALSESASGKTEELLSYAGYNSDGSVQGSGQQQPSDVSYYEGADGQTVSTEGVIFDGSSLPSASFDELSSSAQDTISNFDLSAYTSVLSQ